MRQDIPERVAKKKAKRQEKEIEGADHNNNNNNKRFLRCVGFLTPVKSFPILLQLSTTWRVRQEEIEKEEEEDEVKFSGHEGSETVKRVIFLDSSNFPNSLGKIGKLYVWA